ncbi:alpha/beta hydrolase [Rhizobium sp. BK251]|uniref:alpha/beta fold hydrolase n=1 Tax=Rhizobium sp. BK251 TaxID=2512125 RepID=UPI001048565B|nr:alpha/beta hydrolase [Rhizobium sp. BK251]TCL68222.1 pimeloyl-ACP methyl ester carboxylesterase [Rhizobium sp. BK251]
MDGTCRTIATRYGNVRLDDSMGAGFPLLMVHGSSYSRRVFRKQMESPLARRWRVIAVDLLGHGESDDANDPDAYAITRHAECLEEVTAKLGLRRFAMFGWSLGGHLAVEMMSRESGMAGLMLCGAPPVPLGMIGMLRGFHASFDLLLASKQVFSERDAERFEWLTFGNAGDPSFKQAIMRADGRARKTLSQSMLRGDGADQRRVIERASVPVALIHGSEDPFVRLSYLTGLHIPDLFQDQVEIVQGAGHAPFWERPDIFNRFLDGFMEDVVMHEARHWSAGKRALPLR